MSPGGCERDLELINYYLLLLLPISSLTQHSQEVLFSVDFFFPPVGFSSLTRHSQQVLLGVEVSSVSVSDRRNFNAQQDLLRMSC